MINSSADRDYFSGGEYDSIAIHNHQFEHTMKFL
jgi:hypothetical protein